jgi:hypothetical protein
MGSRRWQLSRVRFLLPLFFASALLCGGCASKWERAEKQKRQADSRRAEELRMRALTYGQVQSEGWAEVLYPSESKVFDVNRAIRGSSHSASTARAQTKEFYFDQKVRLEGYRTRGFWGSKDSTLRDAKFATIDANTRGKYEIPNARKKAETKSAAVKDAREANDTLATRNLPGGDREYLGPESKKVRRAVDPKVLANSHSGGTSVSSTGGTVEVGGTLRQLSIDDVREILNKNK